MVFSALLFGVDALDMVGYQVKDLAVCWNDCFRRIFVHQSHESVKELPYYCNELPFEYMYDLFRWKFLPGVVNVSNRLSVLYEYKSGTVNGLNNKYGYGNSCLSETGFSRECLDTSVGCKSELQFIRQMAHRSAH